MLLSFSCPQCGKKTFPFSTKRKLMRKGTAICDSCGVACEMPSLLKLFVSLFMAFLMPTFFIFFFGVNGFMFSLVVTSLSILLIYFVLIYISPIKVSGRKQQKSD